MLGVVALLGGSALACWAADYICEDDAARRELVDAVVLVGSIGAGVIVAGWLTNMVVGGLAQTAATVVIGFLGGYPTALFLSEREGSRSRLLS